MGRLIADGLIYDGILGATGGLLPVNGPLKKMQDDGVLLVGDAGGLSEPFCGGGVALAIVSGEYAGALISDAHQNKVPDILTGYDDVVRKHLPQVPPFALDVPELLIDRLACMAQWQPPVPLHIE